MLIAKKAKLASRHTLVGPLVLCELAQFLAAFSAKPVGFIGFTLVRDGQLLHQALNASTAVQFW